jgi:hypothetical protein
MAKDLTTTVTVDLLKCAKSLVENSDGNLTFLRKTLAPIPNPREQFFQDFPRSSISLTIGEEKLTITYDQEQKRTIARDSSGQEIQYQSVSQRGGFENGYTNFENCLKAATKGKITDQQIAHIADSFHQASIAVQGFNLLDLQSLLDNTKTGSTHYHDTLHVEFDKADRMGLSLRTAICVRDFDTLEQNVIGYAEYRGVVAKDGSLVSSTTSIQGDESNFLFEKLTQDCVTKEKTPSIKTKIVEHIIDTGKEMDEVCSMLDHKGKTIAEEILIKFTDKMVHSLDENFKKLKGQKLTKENKKNIKADLKQITESFSKVQGMSNIIEKLDLDAIVRRSAREHTDIKQDFKSRMAKYFSRMMDLAKSNKRVESVMKASDIINAFKEHISTHNSSNHSTRSRNSRSSTQTISH